MVFKRGTRASDALITMLACRNGLGHARLGLAISKKAARHATARNRIKRLAREAFRHHQAELAGLDVVVMARPAATSADNDALHASLVRHCTELPARCVKS